MKDNPYFKFYTSDWLNGRIMLEDFTAQGLFISVCAYYWHNSGDLLLIHCNKRFKQPETMQTLISENLIELDGERIKIKFLDEQLEARGVKAEQNRINGSKGGRPKNPKETEIKPNGLFLETETKPNDNPNETNIEKSREENSKIKEKKKKNIGFQPNFDELESWMVEPLKIWYNYKKAKKQNYVDIGWNALVKKMKASFTNENDLMKAIENTMANNWQGIVVPTANPKTTTDPMHDDLTQMDYSKPF
jgi:hypothetical protein